MEHKEDSNYLGNMLRDAKLENSALSAKLKTQQKTIEQQKTELNDLRELSKFNLLNNQDTHKRMQQKSILARFMKEKEEEIAEITAEFNEKFDSMKLNLEAKITEKDAKIEYLQGKLTILRDFDKQLIKLADELQEMKIKEENHKKHEEALRKEIEWQLEEKKEKYKEKMEEKLKLAEKNVDKFYDSYFKGAEKVLSRQNRELLSQVELAGIQLEQVSKENSRLFKQNAELRAQNDCLVKLKHILKKKKNPVKTPEKPEITLSTARFRFAAPEITKEEPSLRGKCITLESKLNEKRSEIISWKNKFEELTERVDSYRVKFAFLFDLLDSHLSVVDRGDSVEFNLKQQNIKFGHSDPSSQYAFVLMLLNFMFPLVDKERVEQSFARKTKGEVKYLGRKNFEIYKKRRTNSIDTVFTGFERSKLPLLSQI